MPRRAAITPNSRLSTTLPADLRTRLDLLLWSELEQRVPKGAYQEFFVARTNEFFSDKPLDLAPYTGAAPGEHVIRGPIAAIHMLLELLAPPKETSNE